MSSVEFRRDKKSSYRELVELQKIKGGKPGTPAKTLNGATTKGAESKPKD